MSSPPPHPSSAGPSRQPDRHSAPPTPAPTPQTSALPPLTASAILTRPGGDQPGPTSLFPPLQMPPASAPSLPMPEKCLTFCSQRADAPPLCRMFCLRRRELGLSRSEHLAKIQARPIRRMGNATDPLSSAASSSSSSSSHVSTTSSSGTEDRKRWSPFAALKRRLEPYSFIYVRGTPDGVVGRYMEELEYDDGQHDFGKISRGYGSDVNGGRRRQELEKVERIDWGEEGYIFRLPMTSLFSPIVNLPENMSRLFAPPIALWTAYRKTFEDGTQVRALSLLRKDVESGGAKKMLHKLDGYLEKRIEDDKAEKEKAVKKAREERERVSGEKREGGEQLGKVMKKED